MLLREAAGTICGGTSHSSPMNYCLLKTHVIGCVYNIIRRQSQAPGEIQPIGGLIRAAGGSARSAAACRPSVPSPAIGRAPASGSCQKWSSYITVSVTLAVISGGLITDSVSGNKSQLLQAVQCRKQNLKNTIPR